MEKLQRALYAAARVITGTRKFDRGQILHWLDVPDRVLFHVAGSDNSPTYLSEHCIPVSSADTRLSSLQHRICNSVV